MVRLRTRRRTHRPLITSSNTPGSYRRSSIQKWTSVTITILVRRFGTMRRDCLSSGSRQEGARSNASIFPSGSLLKTNCAHLSPYIGQDSIVVTILMFGSSSSMAVINGSGSPPSLTWKKVRSCFIGEFKPKRRSVTRTLPKISDAHPIGGRTVVDVGGFRAVVQHDPLLRRRFLAYNAFCR